MDAQTISNADYLDILFDNRNKLYGGYALRKTQDKRMAQSLLIILSFALAFCIWTFIDAHRAGASTVTVKPVDTLVYRPTVIKVPEPKPIPPKEIPKEMPAAAKPTIKNTVSVIVPDVKVVAPPPPVDSFVGRDSGPVTNTGKPDGKVLNTKKGGGEGLEVVKVPDVIQPYAEEMPQYPGDIYAYLAKSVKYPQTAINNDIQGRVIVGFVVNEDGVISNAVVKRGIGSGCDEEALRVVNAMPAWKPGRQNGKAVKVYYTLPINFKLQ